MTQRISARTVVEAFLPTAGSVPLSIVYDAANAVGIPDQVLRLALRRLIGSGSVSQHGRGRAGEISLTAAGAADLARDRMGLLLAFAQDAGRHRWDGRWRLLSISMPESQRAGRDALRRALLEAGAASASTALFVSPHDLTDLIDPAAQTQLVSAVADTLSVHGASDPIEIAETLWPAAAVDAAYDQVLRAIEQDDAAADPRVRRLRLADALDRALRTDPLVPPELRERPWRPAQIRDMWRGLWDDIPDAPISPYDGWLALSE